MKQFKCRASASGKLMTNPRGKDATISKTTISYLQEWYKENLYGHRKELNNKYINKGLALEDVAIDKMIEWLDLSFVMKNTDKFSDDHFTGEPDVICDGIVYDTKCSWDCFTFPLFEEELPNKDYFYQMQVYMHLTGCKKAVVCYVLLDSDDDWSDTNYNELGKDLRCKSFEIDYDAEVIKKMIERVEASREYLETIKIG